MMDTRNGNQPPSGILVKTALTYTPSMIEKGTKYSKTREIGALQMMIITIVNRSVVMSMTTMTTTPAGKHGLTSYSNIVCNSKKNKLVLGYYIPNAFPISFPSPKPSITNIQRTMRM